MEYHNLYWYLVKTRNSDDYVRMEYIKANKAFRKGNEYVAEDAVVDAKELYTGDDFETTI